MDVAKIRHLINSADPEDTESLKPLFHALEEVFERRKFSFGVSPFTASSESEETPGLKFSEQFLAESEIKDGRVSLMFTNIADSDWNARLVCENTDGSSTLKDFDGVEDGLVGVGLQFSDVWTVDNFVKTLLLLMKDIIKKKEEHSV